MEKQKQEYYHVTTSYQGESQVFRPSIPYYLQKGEDKKNPRLCVTENWKHSARSIVVLKRSRRLYVYVSFKKPINPSEKRFELLKVKKIRKNYNDFRLPRDGIVNNELWFLDSTKMFFKGMIEIPEEEYAKMIMAMGFPSGDPDINKFKLKPYEEEKGAFW